MREATLPPAQATEPSGPNRLLVVDDEQQVCEALKRTLYRDGYEIHVAHSAEEALAVLEREQIDVIVSDQRMSQRKGTELLAEVRDRYPRTVRLILSGAADLDDVVHAMETGAIHKFLTKPIQPALFRANVREAFARAAAAGTIAGGESGADAATGLPTRRAAEKAFGELAARARRSHQRLCLLMLKVDQHDAIVRSFGWSFGQQFLRQVGAELDRAFGPGYVLAHDAPGTFLLATAAEDPVSRIARLNQLLEEMFANPFAIAGRRVMATLSVGATTTDGSNGFDATVDEAYTAMVTGSDRGGDTVQLYQPDLATAFRGGLELESDFRQALAGGAFSLHYQPQVDVSAGRIVGLEALLRWRHAEHGFVSPAKFVPLAERLGLINELGKWVLDTAAGQLAYWRRSRLAPPELAVNVSALQLMDPSLVEHVRTVVRRHGLAAHELVLEVTESAAIEQQKSILDCLHALHELGVTLAVDDFGTGYANLANLTRFSFSKLKIDRSLLQQTREERGRKLYANVVAMARGLGLVPLAEGVETAAELASVREAGCLIVQGYLYSRPLEAAQLESLLGKDELRIAPAQTTPSST
jgi:EAL domain-containing protein (putative c-di-GMP-specific phosphodiesterase class I)/PleD family two-component response regulator